MELVEVKKGGDKGQACEGKRGWDGDAVYRQICDAWRRRNQLPERYREPLSRQLTTSAIATETSHIFVAQA